MASVDSIVAALRRAAERVGQALNHAQAGREGAEASRDLMRRLGVDGTAARFAGVADTADRLEQTLRTGVEQIERLIAQTEAIRSAGTATATTRPGPPTTPTASAPGSPGQRAPTTPGWRRASEVPEDVRVAGAGLPPRGPKEDRYTLGILDGEAIYSGGEGEHLADDLAWPRSAPPVTYWQHVESKVAARMRREHRRHAEVTIDNTVCGTNERDRNYPFTCDKVLPSILPAGSRLVVWVTCDGGRSFWRHAYDGTGERIRP
jgi:hypothetical protein